MSIIPPKKPTMLPSFLFSFWWPAASFLVIGRAHSFSCKGSKCLPSLGKKLTNLPDSFWTCKPNSHEVTAGQVQGVILTLLRRTISQLCIVLPRTMQMKAKGFLPEQGQKDLRGERSEARGCGCFKIGCHFVERLSLGVICKWYSNVVVSLI